MKTYISDIIPRIQNFSQKLENITLLTDQHWVVIDDIDSNKNVYIFRKNNELLISKNGIVEKARWEYLGHNSLLIDKKDESYLFKHGFFDENILALKIDSKDEYALLVNETKFDKELNSSLRVIDFLNQNYNDLGANTITIYQTPNHTINKIGEHYPFLSNSVVQYVVKFEDGEKGDLFQKKKNKQAYFKGNIWNVG